MESPQTSTDAVLASLDFDAIVGDVPAPAQEAAAPAEADPFAPVQESAPTESSTAETVSPDAAAATPSDQPATPPAFDFDSDDNPYKAEAQEARKMRQTLQKAYEVYQQQEAQRQAQ